MKPIRVDIPYPNIDKIQPNYADGVKLAKAYSGMHGEITAVLQYIYHHFYFEKYLDKDTADTLMSISIAEMEHFEKLGRAILKLGLDPVITLNLPYRFNAYNTSEIIYSKEPQKMLLDDISGELVAIKNYEEILTKLSDETAKALVKRIILDEELHVIVLKQALEKISQ